MKPYKTLARAASGEFIINKSRFIGHGAPIQSEAEALAFLQSIRDVHKAANHNCFAYVIGENAGIQRYSDDGEPGGTAGLPIIGVLHAKGVVNAAVVVTRYFGGILLGAGGLTRAYSKGASTALSAAGVVTMHPTDTLLISLEYSLYDKVSHRLLSQPVEILSTEYAADVLITLRIRSTDMAALQEAIDAASDGRAEALLIETGFGAWNEEIGEEL